MRLAVVSPFVDRRHGTERALAEMLERLSERHEWEVHLYAQRVNDLNVSSARGSFPGHRAIIWHKVPSAPGPHLVQFLAWILFNSILRRWHTTIDRLSYDLVLSPGINCLDPDAVIVHALFHRVRELSTEEDTRSAEPAPLVRLHRSLYYRLLTRLERKIYSNPRVALAAVSRRTAGLLARYFDRKDVSIVPNGVDTSYFCPAARLAKRAEARNRLGFRDHDFVLLLIGNDWNAKGLPTVLEAIAAVDSLSVRLLVVGSDVAAPFQAKAKELGVMDRCTWETPRPDVIDLYAATDIYVSPSREDSFGLPVVEAMACGLAVITSIFAGVSEHIHDEVDGLILQDPRDSRKLAEWIQRLQTDPELRRSLGEAATRKARGLSWQRYADAAQDFLVKGLSTKRAAASV